jgi:hypothetical protein
MNVDLVLELIQQSVSAETLPRRRAASILLKAVRAGPSLANVPHDLALVSAGLARNVADEVRTLIARYDLESGPI